MHRLKIKSDSQRNNPVLSYESAKTRKALVSLQKLIYGSLACAILICVALILYRTSRNRVRDEPAWLDCECQMRMIGMGIALYANEHHGSFPPTLNDLEAHEGLESTDLGCVEDRQFVPGPPGHEADQSKVMVIKTSYVYLGKGMSTIKDHDPKEVVVYEPVSNHGDGANFLFADGHSAYIEKKSAERMIQDLEAGINPPGIR